ncbi:hypothetical protein GCM10010497_48020 [Streptomyces cinereoruber]|uniref:Uncharacterized protein n=1 Tax=Streptomyces cinereoruber TaxID=67260 RepID=A0AAV4KR94_9ACTN|nr:hypothetical protein GCM10010497_48020 [Streptomyces cinereoruber]
MDGTSISFWDVTLDVTQGRCGVAWPCDKSLTAPEAPTGRAPAPWDEKGPEGTYKGAKGPGSTDR